MQRRLRPIKEVGSEGHKELGGELRKGKRGLRRGSFKRGKGRYESSTPWIIYGEGRSPPKGFKGKMTEGKTVGLVRLKPKKKKRPWSHRGPEEI